MIRRLLGRGEKPAEPARPNVDYAKEVEEFVQMQRQLTADISTVQLIGGSDPRIVIRPTKEGGMRAARRIANNLTDIADANLIDSAVGDEPPNGFRQPPRHTHYKDDRKARHFVISVAHDQKLFVLRTDRQWAEYNDRMDASKILLFDSEEAAEAYREKLGHIPGVQINSIAA